MDAPQRHSEYAGFPVKSYLLPLASTSSTCPSGSSTRNGPFGRAVIFTDMIPPRFGTQKIGCAKYEDIMRQRCPSRPIVALCPELATYSPSEYLKARNTFEYSQTRNAARSTA